MLRGAGREKRAEKRHEERRLPHPLGRTRDVESAERAAHGVEERQEGCDGQGQEEESPFDPVEEGARLQRGLAACLSLRKSATWRFASSNASVGMIFPRIRS